MRRHPDVTLIRRILAGQWPGDHDESAPPPLPAEVWSAYVETFVIWYGNHGGPAGEVTARPGSTLVFARDAMLAADGLRGIGRREEKAPALTRAEQLQGCLNLLREIDKDWPSVPLVLARSVQPRCTAGPAHERCAALS